MEELTGVSGGGLTRAQDIQLMRPRPRLNANVLDTQDFVLEST